MAENKVQFNLKNVHYAINTGDINTPVYSTPVAVPGAVTLTLDPQGSSEPFYADGIVYYQAIANNGYAGDLEMALFPEEMLEDVWGFSVDTNGVMTENANTEPKSFALMYQIDGDQEENYYTLFNCVGTRPAVGSSTTTDSKTPNTRTSSITATPLADGRVMKRTTSTTEAATKTAWFNSVV